MMIDCSTRSGRKAIFGAARALCSGATRRGKVLDFTQLDVHGDAVAVNVEFTGKLCESGGMI
jgi:hypothetical protein